MQDTTHDVAVLVVLCSLAKDNDAKLDVADQMYVALGNRFSSMPQATWTHSPFAFSGNVRGTSSLWKLSNTKMFKREFGHDMPPELEAKDKAAAWVSRDRARVRTVTRRLSVGSSMQFVPRHGSTWYQGNVCATSGVLRWLHE